MRRNIMIVAAALALSLAVIGPVKGATVYIPEGSAGEVLVVDAATDAVVDRLAGLPDIHGLGGAPGARYLVAGSYSETPSNDMPAITKPAGVSQEEHAAHHGAAAKTSDRTNGAVSILTVIDAANRSSVRRLEVPGAVHHVAVSPDGRYAVATHPNNGGISVVDLSDLTVGALIRTGPIPNYAVFNADGSRVYVSNSGNGTVSEIDTERWSVERDLPAGESPEHIVLAPDGRILYVADVQTGTVSTLAVEKGDIVRRFAIGGEPHGLDVSDDGDTLFVSNKSENKIVAIDLVSGGMRAAPLAPAPYHVTVVRQTGKLYVSSRDEPKVWVVDQASLAVRGVIATQGIGHQMVVLP